MLTNLKTIADVLELLDESYPGKMKLTQKTPKIWLRFLADLESETVLAAAYHLVSTTTTWPPDVAMIRDQSVKMAQGMTDYPAGEMSWARVARKIAGDETVVLGKIEKKALAATGKIYDLARSQNPAADRSRYLSAYAQAIREHHLSLCTTPDVKAYLDGAQARTERFLPADTGPIIDKREENENQDYLQLEELSSLLRLVGGKFGIGS